MTDSFKSTIAANSHLSVLPGHELDASLRNGLLFVSSDASQPSVRRQEPTLRPLVCLLVQTLSQRRGDEACWCPAFLFQQQSMDEIGTLVFISKDRDSKTGSAMIQTITERAPCPDMWGPKGRESKCDRLV